MMRSILAGLQLLGCSAVVQQPSYAEMWASFKADFGKTYAGNGEGSDEESRFKVFVSNVDKIREHNKNMSYRLGINQFADMTAEEFAAIYIGGYLHSDRRSGSRKLPFPDIVGQELEDQVDWVAKGGVTPVKNQGHCGSCWSFSTTGAIEGAYFAASGQLISLSEEDLVQCDSEDNGCHGGIMEHAFEWIEQNGICSEDAYSYTSGGGRRGRCHVPACQPVVTITGYVDVPSRDEDALKAAVASQPVSVAIEADKRVFQLYRGGVFQSDECGTQLDHAVLVVGYGTEGGMDYWKVKNSWGVSWGEGGYIRMARGTDLCGIAMQASYPTGVKAAGPSPGPSPPPPGPSPPPPPAGTHYGDPSDGCLSDELDMRVQGFSGDFCSADCSDSDCPTDVPEGVTARPTCGLRFRGGKRCALLCSSSRQCGAATCQHNFGVGLCTYSDEAVGGPRSSLLLSEQTEIVV